jgi:hypothetical protein
MISPDFRCFDTQRDATWSRAVIRMKRAIRCHFQFLSCRHRDADATLSRRRLFHAVAYQRARTLSRSAALLPLIALPAMLLF